MKNKLIGTAVLAVACLVVESRAYNAVYFTSPTRGFLLGDTGTLWNTVDAGEHWTRKALGKDWSLSAMHFPTPQVGYIVGGSTILKTVDGGETWTDPRKYKAFELFSSVHFTSTEVGHAVGIAIQEKTQDGGITWPDEGNRIGLGNPSFNDIWFTDSSHGVEVGQRGLILRSVDGGATWDSTAVKTPETLQAVHFPTASVGYAVGGRGVILKSTDNGATWSLQNSKTTANLSDVFFVDASKGYAVGELAILKTTDGGATWTSQRPSVNALFGSVWFTDSNTGFAAGIFGFDGVFLKTTDGGDNWTSKSPGAPVIPGQARSRQVRLLDDGTLAYELPATAAVRYGLFDPRGRSIHQVRRSEGAGAHAIGMPDRAQGIYLIDFQAGGVRRAFSSTTLH